MKKSILIILSFYSIIAFGQVDSNQVNKQKLRTLQIGTGAVYGLGMYLETTQLEQDSLGGKYNLGKRYHEWYLSLDLDLSQIKTPYPLLNKFLFLTRIFKTPMPTLSYSGKNGFQFKPYYF